MNTHIRIPGSVLSAAQGLYKNNWRMLTANTGSLFLLTGDQVLEHSDTYISHDHIIPESFYPSHMFRIAHNGEIPLETYYGFIAQYGTQFPTIPYIVKMTGTTHTLQNDTHTTGSIPLATIDDILTLQKNTHLTICGVSMTVHMDNMQEPHMLSYAAQTIIKAHQYGFITILEIHTQANTTHNTESNSHSRLVSIAASLGTDFVKLVPTQQGTDHEKMQAIRTITAYTEHTGILCADNLYISELEPFLHQISLYKNKGNIRGIAIGKNLIQRSLPEAGALCAAIKTIVHGHSNSQSAYELYQKMVQK